MGFRRAPLRSGSKPFERFPENLNTAGTWLGAIYGERVSHWGELALASILRNEVTGKKLPAFATNTCGPLRNRVGHALMDNGALGASTDDLTQLDEIRSWLPITRTMARRMMKNDFHQFLESLTDPPPSNQ